MRWELGSQKSVAPVQEYVHEDQALALMPVYSFTVLFELGPLAQSCGEEENLKVGRCHKGWKYNGKSKSAKQSKEKTVTNYKDKKGERKDLCNVL